MNSFQELSSLYFQRVIRSPLACDVHIPQWRLMVLGELCARAIPWFKQILKVFIFGLAGRNGPFLKVL
jgi:hypothetical protein